MPWCACTPTPKLTPGGLESALPPACTSHPPPPGGRRCGLSFKRSPRPNPAEWQPCPYHYHSSVMRQACSIAPTEQGLAERVVSAFARICWVDAHTSLAIIRPPHPTYLAGKFRRVQENSAEVQNQESQLEPIFLGAVKHHLLTPPRLWMAKCMGGQAPASARRAAHPSDHWSRSSAGTGRSSRSASTVLP